MNDSSNVSSHRSPQHDKSNVSVPTLDCCFHPKTVDMSLKVPGFKDLVVETARETCVRGFKNVKDEVEIDKKYHVLNGITYKTGEVVTMIISKEKSKGQWEEKKEQPKGEKVRLVIVAFLKCVYV